VVILCTTSKKLRHDLMQLKRNTPGYLMALGRAKFKNTGEVERPDKNVHYANLRATEIRPPSKEYLDGLIIALARDDSSSNEILGNTDQNSKGGRAAEQQRNIGGNHIMIAATNVMVKDMEEADRWETLRPITYFMPTPEPSGQTYTSRNRGDLHEDDSNRDTKEFPDNDATRRQAMVLRVSSIVTGTMIGLMQQMKLIEVNIYPPVNALNSLFRAEMDTVFGWARHPCFTASDFSRKHRTCITRGVVDHCIYRLMYCSAREPKFDKAINDTLYALQVNALEPVDTVAIFHNTLRQTVDMPMFVFTNLIAKSMKVPLLPFAWIQAVVARGGCTAGDVESDYDLNSPHCRKMRAWVNSLMARNQLLRATTSTGVQSQRREPYVSSPANEDGNSVCNAEQRLAESASEHIFRVNEVDSNGHTACMARNLTAAMYPFFQATNVERNAKNLVPMITRHSEKVCDMRALFNMKNVMDMGFFMRLFHDQDDFDALDPCLRAREQHGSNNVITLGMFNSKDKSTEGKPSFTAYGTHITALVVMTAFLGPDFSPSSMAAVQIASRITEHLLQDVPRALLYPSGDSALMKVMLQRDVPLQVHVKQRDSVQAQFFYRRRNGEKIANRPVEQNVTECEAQLSSPLRPFWYEDCMHCFAWIPCLRLAHAKVLNQWNTEGVIDLQKLRGSDAQQHVAEDQHPVSKLTIQELILSLAPHRLPCDPTLLYGTPYPCVGTGATFLNDDDSIRLLFASVVVHDAKTTTLTIFEDGFAPNRVITEYPTNKIFEVLLQKKMLVLPSVARPSALVHVATEGFYGTLHYDQETLSCYNPNTAKYTCRYFHNGTLSKKYLTALDIADVLVQEREKIFLRTDALLAIPLIGQLLPVGAENTYMQAKLWYPEDISQYEEDHICVLIRRGTSDRFELCKVHVSSVESQEKMNPSMRVLPGVRFTV
jgi:hypothetical protein